MTRTCECGKQFEYDKYHIWQKQCTQCRKKKKRKAHVEWYKKNGKEYMKNYMKTYRFLSFALFYLVCVPHEIMAEYSGNAALRGTFQKPPEYELHLKAGDRSYFALNRFQIKKSGWMPKKQRGEDEDDPFAMFESEPKEAGSWSVEYGATATQSEMSLLDQESVYGWKIGLGQVSEFAWGRSMSLDRIAMANFNTEKFSFSAYKSFGKKETDQDYLFLNTDTAKTKDKNDNPNLPIITAKPIEKGEGGALKIPFQWRQLTGDIEIAGKTRYDEFLKDYKNGVGFLLNANTPRFNLTIRHIMIGFESEVRTSEVSLKLPFYKTENSTFRVGTKIIDFSGNKLKTRYETTLGAEQNIIRTKNYSLRLSADAGTYLQGENIGITASGNATLRVLETNLSIRRNENLTGQSSSTSNSLSISRKEGSLSLSQNSSEYRTTKAENLNANIYLNPFKHIKIGAGIGQSTQNTPFKTTTMINSNYSIAYRDLRFNTVISPRNENYNITRTFPLEKYGKTVGIGLSYQRFLKGEGVTGNLSYTW